MDVLQPMTPSSHAPTYQQTSYNNIGKNGTNETHKATNMRINAVSHGSERRLEDPIVLRRKFVNKSREVSKKWTIWSQLNGK